MTLGIHFIFIPLLLVILFVTVRLFKTNIDERTWDQIKQIFPYSLLGFLGRSGYIIFFRVLIITILIGMSIMYLAIIT